MGVASNSLQQSWKPWPTRMVQNYIPPFPYSHTQSLNTLPPLQLLQPKLNSYLSYPQGWNSLSYDHMATLPHVATQLGPSVSTSQTNPIHQPHLSSHETPWYPTQFPIQSTLHLTIIKQYSMLTVLNCKIFLHSPLVLPHLHH